jgi:hypothetical protein
MARLSLYLLVVVAGLVSPGSGRSEPPVTDAKAEVFGEFTGSSPCGEPFGRLFDIPPDADPPVRWTLTLYQDSKAKSPTVYKLRAEFNGAKPPAARKQVTKDKEGRWSVGKGTKFNNDAIVYELAGAVNFYKVTDAIVQAMSPDRALAVGNGGWSYTLNRTTAAEKVVVPSADSVRRSESYTMSPVASGENVFGVFEGRTPAQGVCRELKIATEADRMKAKWRVTLYQDPKTRAPTSYKVEGSLHRKEVRAGTWSVDRDNGTVVYHLSETKTEAGLFLLKGDDNVLFFLGQDRKPMVGHADFSYTLNRRNPTTPNR